jgi:O-antigen ligase
MRSLAYAALWLFVFTVPWENAIVIPGLGVISKFTGMLAVGLTVVAIVVSGRVRRWQGFHLTALLFVIWAGGVLWVNSNEPDLPNTFWTYPQLFLVLLMVWEIAPSRPRVQGLMVAYVLGALVAALQTIVAFQLHGSTMRRFSTGTADPNAVAMTLALGLPIAWYLGMTYRQPLMRWICRGYLPAALLAIALTGSRGGLLAGMVGLLIVPLTMTTLSPGRLAMAIALLALSGAVAVAYVPDTIVQRFATTKSSIEDLSLGGRFEIWKAGLHAFTYRPLAGYGAGSFKRAASPWLGGQERVAHNSFLSILVEQGMIGFLLYSMIFLGVLLAVLTLPPMERRFALVLLAAVGTAMLPLSWEFSKPVWFILGALLGFSQAQGTRTAEAVPQPGPLGTARWPEPPRGARPRPPLNAPVRRAGPDAPA